MYYTSIAWVYAQDISGFKLILIFWQLIEEIQGEGIFSEVLHPIFMENSRTQWIYCYGFFFNTVLWRVYHFHFIDEEIKADELMSFKVQHDRNILAWAI